MGIIGSRGLIKIKISGFHPRVSDSIDLEWGPKIYIPNKFPSNADDAGAGPSLFYQYQYRERKEKCLRRN